MTLDIEALRSRLAAQKRLSLSVRVIPKSPKTAWAGQMDDGSVKIRIAAPPEKGKANEELIRFLAREFHVPASAVELISGAASAYKQIRISLAN